MRRSLTTIESFFILVFQNSNGNCDLHNMSNLQNNTDSLGAKIDKAKIPNGWKILFERISSTLYIFFGSCRFDVRLTFVFISHRMISLCPKSAWSTVISLEICTKGWPKKKVTFFSVVFFGQLPTSISRKRFIRMT